MSQLEFKFILSIDVEKNPYTKEQGRVLEKLKEIIFFLDERNLPCTIFATGKMIESFPDYFSNLNKRHEIACHGYSHIDVSNLSQSQLLKEIKRATETISSVSDDPAGFRAPRLNVNTNVLKILKHLGYLYDSSTPFFKDKKDDSNIYQIRPIPNYFLKIPFGEKLVNRINPIDDYNEEYKAYFFHPWELQEVKKKYLVRNPKELLKPYNYWGNGQMFKFKVFSLIESLSRKFDFITGKGYVKLLDKNRDIYR